MAGSEEEAEELFRRVFAGKKGKEPKTRKKQFRKDGITEVELTIYKRAVENKGNNWKDILAFFASHKELLPTHVAKKYESAERGEGVKSIRNRLGNIGRKVKNSREVSAREERNVVEGENMTAEKVILSMKNIKQAEAKDPLNKRSPLYSDSETLEPGIGELNPDTPGASGIQLVETRNKLSSESLSDSSLEWLSGREDPLKEPSSKPNEEKKKLKKGKQSKGISLKRLHSRAEQLIDVGFKAAKMHMKFLKQSAKIQGLDMESDIESTE